MKKFVLGFFVVTSLSLLAAQLAHARGYGGARGGSSGGAQRGNYSSAESRGGYSSGGERGGPPSSGHGPAIGAAAEHRSQPQYSGAQGAAAGYAAANHNQPPYSGAQGAAAGYAAANRNQPQYFGAQGAVTGYAAGVYQTPPAYGVVGGYSGGVYAPVVRASQTALPTDAGYAMSATGGSAPVAAATAGYHQTSTVSSGIYAARGAAVRTSYNSTGVFDQGWYAAHPDAWNPNGWTAGRAWDAATWPTVASWYGWADNAPPVYYDYGNNISYQGGQVYYGDQPVASADQYYQQASALAQSQPAPAPNAGEWMPLGVFGLVRSDEADPHYVLQLAVNKSGAVAGNYYDTVSGTSVPVTGAVDQKTQRLAWTVGSNQNTVGETGLGNLLKDESPALIHIGKNKTQQWLLVRLKQPEQERTK